MLGGGNLSGIPPTDILHQVFVVGRPVVLKTHPVAEVLAPLLEEAFAPLIARGLLAVARGHPDVGRTLVADPRIAAIHLTGSARTYEAIVFGEGEEGARRRARGERLLHKPVTAELGNVTPLIVVPGAWSNREIRRQARHVASMLTNNAGFNCAAVRVVVTARRWRQREAFLDALRAALAAATPRTPWYPGSAATYEAHRAAHPRHEELGQISAPDQVPWLFLPDLDASSEDPCFRQEAFGPILSEVSLDAETPAEFVREAVVFANERLWGTLAAHLLVHPSGSRGSRPAGRGLGGDRGPALRHGRGQRVGGRRIRDRRDAVGRRARCRARGHPVGRRLRPRDDAAPRPHEVHRLGPVAVHVASRVPDRPPPLPRPCGTRQPVRGAAFAVAAAGDRRSGGSWMRALGRRTCHASASSVGMSKPARS